MLRSYVAVMIINTPTNSIIKPLHEDYKLDLFELANDEETALLSSHWEPVEWENHCKWFDKRMMAEDFLVMIIAPAGNFLGHVDLKRIDRHNQHAEKQQFRILSRKKVRTLFRRSQLRASRSCLPSH